MPSFRPKRIALAAGLLLACAPALAQSTSEADLARRLEQLAAEIAALKAQLATLQQQRAAQPAATPAPPTAQAATAAPASAAAEPARPGQPATTLGGYAEINYNRPTRKSENTQADLRRLVVGVAHRFDDKTRVVTEIEVEHAVTSADDAGEVAIEQAYVERQLNPTWALRGGLVLMPLGLLNENHEPTAYYGVERNFVETAIIPSTWREGAIQAVGAFDNGISAQFGIATGFDLTKWDAASTEGLESPLGAVHQELAQAKARDLAAFGAVNWRGIPGLLLGGGAFSGGATHGQGPSARVTLWDVHARWTPGRWDLSALYTRGNISNTAALNAPLVGNPTLIPRTFDGGYLQAAYNLWQRADYALAPFVRFERFNTAKSYADLGPGITPAALPDERVWTAGANFQLTPGVVVKADVQRFRQNTDNNRVNLGLGWSF